MTRNDLKVQIWPISGWMATMTAMSVPPAAASAAANPKVIRWMRPTLMPHTMATSRLCDVARMALPSFVLRRNTKTAAVMMAAKTNATMRDFDTANGPTTKDPVRNSTARRSDVNASWARFTTAIEMPKVRSSEDSSGASTTRKTSVRSSSMPITKSAAIDTGSVR